MAINVNLTVSIPPPVARFTVTGDKRGENQCSITNGNGDTDCRLDATASGGFARFYSYTYAIGSSTVTDVKTDPMNIVDIADPCTFFKDHSTADDNGDKYFNMDISLQIEDREGSKSSVTKKTIRMYPQGNCGY